MTTLKTRLTRFARIVKNTRWLGNDHVIDDLSVVVVGGLLIPVAFVGIVILGK